MNKLFMFDCYGVLISTISIPWFESHYPKEIYMEKCKYFMEGLDIGDRSFKSAIEMIAHDLNKPWEEIYDSWIHFTHINFPLLNKIKELKKIGKTAIVSNAPSGLVEEIFKINGIDLYIYFDKVFISADYKMMKPDLRFYKTCIESFNESFDLLTMVDDREINLKFVNQLNIKPILYKSNEQLFPILDSFQK